MGGWPRISLIIRLSQPQAGDWAWLAWAELGNWSKSQKVSDILGLELMSEGIETLLEKKKANGIMLGFDFILPSSAQASKPIPSLGLR